MITVKQLKSFIPFKGLDTKYIEEALNQIRVETFARGTMLFKRSKPLAMKYYLVEGDVDLIDSEFYCVSVKSDTKRAQSALNSESPTKCSALAKSSVTVFTIETELLDRIVAWSQTSANTLDTVLEVSEEGANTTIGSSFSSNDSFMVEELSDDSGDWMSALLQSPLFSRIPVTQVQELFSRFEDVHAEAGERIITEGERGDYFYVLASGEARIHNRSESVDVRLRPGSHFGEEALLGATLRNATVEMTADGILKRLGSEDFIALLKAPVLKYIEDNSLQSFDKPYKLIDVKMPIEYRLNHMPGSINVPLSRLRNTMPELGRSNVYLVPDDAGSRADIAAHLLCQAGFEAMILKTSQ
ncbi:cyclic nucleotide-binding domain-containing protein [Saccharophagus degradans]|uniref:cyclic nucleotide-binding domain-containing protein n=1 Tax=Saccharophagus degradans TaxID=86304 RepID=UPI00247817F0|nr:cyclic nucleotide-binding domain-containing protein [Saccharophagus degradans]WGP00276.1 cyclic nucleotide-binding domain-containing protein [Saccharophagus degradans]